MELTFEHDDPIGRGLFGEVWRAKDVLGRDLAVKFITNADALEEKYALQHASALARVRHPRVVHLIALEEHAHPTSGDRRLAIVMEFIPGNSLNKLNEVLKKDACQIAHDLTDALEAIHEANIIHGDLHDGNVMVHGGRGTLIDMLYTRSLAQLRTTMARSDRDRDYRDLTQTLRTLWEKTGCGVAMVERFMADALREPRTLAKLHQTINRHFGREEPKPLLAAEPVAKQPPQKPRVATARKVFGRVHLEDYEKDGQVKVFVVKGETLPIKEGLKQLGGRWIKSLSGWTFAKTRQAEVEDYLRTVAKE